MSTITDPFFLRWSATFTKTSLFPNSEQQNLQEEMLSFTDYAVQDMVNMMNDKQDPMAMRSGYNPSGSLSLSYEPPVEGVKKENPIRGNNLEPMKQLAGKEIAAIEPSISHQRQLPTTAK